MLLSESKPKAQLELRSQERTRTKEKSPIVGGHDA